MRTVDVRWLRMDCGPFASCHDACYARSKEGFLATLVVFVQLGRVECSAPRNIRPPSPQNQSITHISDKPGQDLIGLLLRRP